MKHLLYILVLTSSLLSCKKDRLIDEKEPLIGTWEWTNSDHFFGACQNMSFFEELYSDSTSDWYEVRFEKKGLISFHKRGTLLDKYRIVFDHFETYPNGDFYYVIHLDNDDENIRSGYGYASDATLTITHFPFTEEPGCGYYVNYFVKQ